MATRRHLVVHKIELQRWLGSAGTGAGPRHPTARFRPLRRRRSDLSRDSAGDATCGHAAKAKPLRLLAVDRDAVPPQQDVQAAITEPATLMRQIAQLLAQAFVARPLGLLKNARSPRRNDPARPPLADIRQGLKMRDRFALGSSRYHFLAAGPSDDGAQVSIVRSNSSS